MIRPDDQHPRSPAAPRPAWDSTPPPDVTTAASGSRPTAWEKIYRSLSAARQAELLSLAQHQGVLYSHQLPALVSGAASEPESQLLTQLFAGHTEKLERIYPDPIDVFDAELDTAQRDAVSKAIHTPDICLVQGPPGSGKSRVTAEIVTQACARGEGVLLASLNSAAIDRVLEWVAPREVLFPIRCVEPKESLEKLSPTIRALTYGQLVRSLDADALQAARCEARAKDEYWQRLRQDEPLWARLGELCRSYQRVDGQIRELRTRHEQVARDVEQEAASGRESESSLPFLASLAVHAESHSQACRRIDKRVDEVREEIERGHNELVALAAQLDTLRPLMEAKRYGWPWKPAWWRAVFRRDILSRWTQLEERRQRAQAAVDGLQGQMASLIHQGEQANATYQTQRRCILDQEIARRQGELDAQKAALLPDLTGFEDKWRELCEGLEPGCLRPIEMTVPALEAARGDWTRKREQAELERTFSSQWVSYLEQAKDSFSARLPAYINLVAGTTAALSVDAHFGDRGATASLAPASFDLLVVEEAHLLAEAELLKLARRARRCVLVGEPAWEEACRDDDERALRKAPERREASLNPRASSAALALAPAFQRLWANLHCDPRRLPYAWVVDNEHLRCRLRAVPATQRQWIESERVADSEDIELRILALPRTRPTLVEVVFPLRMPIDHAKQYIFRELQELAVGASGHSLTWVEENDRLLLRLTPREMQHEVMVDLESGIRESLGVVHLPAKGNASQRFGWQTCCLEFSRAAGWHRRRSEEWIEEHLGLRDLGRTVRLNVLHRMEPDLAAFVAEAVHAETAGPTGAARLTGAFKPGSNGRAAPVEFIAVPPVAKAGERGSQAAHLNSPSPLLSRKGGAGLELDLADPRQRERLPAELRLDLPTRGFVNYMEAQAVVRRLSSLVADSRAHKDLGGRNHCAAELPAVAVVALYAGQAELIRRLIQRAPSLTSAGLNIEVGLPHAFVQREAETVVLSLTRSHTHRAVSFGEGPHLLALAMTRARSRLVVFGDPGTLLRRSQWDGPLEHLDPISAARERDLIAQIVRQLPEQEVHPRSSIRQGSGS